jgi:hypothetical protein
MKISIIFLLLIITVSCTSKSDINNAQKRIEANRSTTIDIHDELMENMGDLRSLKKSLLIKKLDTALQFSNDQIELAIKGIDHADYTMWDWMHNFDVTYTHEDDSVTLKYYKAKLKSIEEVKMLFDSAIIKATKIVN